MARILITDGEQRSSLAATRSLGRAGHEVVVASRLRAPLAGASRYASACIQHPDPAVDAQGYLGRLLRAVDDEEIDLLLPMTDVSVPFGLQVRSARPTIRVPFPEDKTVLEVSDKQRLLEVAASLGVPVPPQALLHGPDELTRGGPDLPFPIVVKPARSAVEGPDGTRRFGVSIAPDLETLRTLVRDHPPEAFPLLLQTRIQGPGLGAFALFWEGEPVAWFAHRRLREKPPTGGVSVYRESIPLRPDLEAHSTRLLGHYRWSGVAMVEFKEDEASGTPYLMEINGRFWGSLQLAIDAGVDFPRMLVARALGLPDSGPGGEYRSGLRSRWLLGDADHLLTMLRRGRALRSTHPDLPGTLTTAGRFLLPWRPGTRFEVLRASDPMPFFRELGLWLREIGGRGP